MGVLRIHLVSCERMDYSKKQTQIHREKTKMKVVISALFLTTTLWGTSSIPEPSDVPAQDPQDMIVSLQRENDALTKRLERVEKHLNLSPADVLKSEATTENGVKETEVLGTGEGKKIDSTGLPEKASIEEKTTDPKALATKEATKHAPDVPQGNEMAQFDQALALYDKKEYNTALKAFDYFIQEYPTHKLTESAYYWKAMCYFQQGPDKYVEARDALKIALDKVKHSNHGPNINIRLAQIEIYNGKYQKASDYLKKDNPKTSHFSEDDKKLRQDLLTQINEKTTKQ